MSAPASCPMNSLRRGSRSPWRWCCSLPVRCWRRAQDFPRRLVEDYVLSRLHHDADLLYVRFIDAAAAAPGSDIDPAM